MKKPLKYLNFLSIVGIAMWLPTAKALAQAAPTVVGSWSLVSLTVQRSGNDQEVLGPHPQGQLILGSDGRYVLMVIRADLPKLASGSQLSATADESKAIAEGGVAHFGTYAVDKEGRAIVFHIRKSTFPNWDGDVQTRPFTIVGDRLTYITPGTFGYGVATVIWQRAK